MFLVLWLIMFCQKIIEYNKINKTKQKRGGSECADDPTATTAVLSKSMWHACGRSNPPPHCILLRVSNPSRLQRSDICQEQVSVGVGPPGS